MVEIAGGKLLGQGCWWKIAGGRSWIRYGFDADHESGCVDFGPGLSPHEPDRAACESAGRFRICTMTSTTTREVS
jgi:hypothetical protein